MDVMMVSPLPLLSLHIYPHTSLQEETFGPIVGIQKVSSDAEALALMNDTPYGLTASIWTDAVSHPESEDAFLRFVDGLSTGTVFLNRWVLIPDPSNLPIEGMRRKGGGYWMQWVGATSWTQRSRGRGWKIAGGEWALANSVCPNTTVPTNLFWDLFLPGRVWPAHEGKIRSYENQDFIKKKVTIISQRSVWWCIWWWNI